MFNSANYLVNLVLPPPFKNKETARIERFFNFQLKAFIPLYHNCLFPGFSSTAVFLKLKRASESPGKIPRVLGPVRRVSDSAALDQSLRIHSSNNFPGDSDASGPGIIL